MARAEKKQSGARKRTPIKDLPAKKVGADKARSVKGGATSLLRMNVVSEKWDLGVRKIGDGSV